MTKNNTNQKTNKQIIIRFIMIIIASLIIGFISGFSTMAISGGNITFTVNYKLIELITASVLVIGNIIAIIIATVTYNKTVKGINDWDGNDEDVIEVLEYALNTPLIISSTMIYINMILFSIGAYMMVKIPDEKRYVMLTLAEAILFIVSLIIYIVIQYKIIATVKKINPEKKGNILDTKFQKDWYESCDEAEKEKICRASYSGYKTGIKAAYTLWLVSFLGMFFGTGVFACIVSIIIIIAMTISYYKACIELERPYSLKGKKA